MLSQVLLLTLYQSKFFGEGDYFKEVVILFHDMINGNVEPNIETCKRQISAYGREGLLRGFKEYVNSYE